MSKHNNAEAISGDCRKGSFEVSNNRSVTQPVSPPAAGHQLAPQYYRLDHQVAPQEERLPYGIGIGWILFILGFFLVLPWYIGLLLRGYSIYGIAVTDRREIPGLIACSIAACICTILILFIGLSVRDHNAYN